MKLFIASILTLASFCASADTAVINGQHVTTGVTSLYSGSGTGSALAAGCAPLPKKVTKATAYTCKTPLVVAPVAVQPQDKFQTAQCPKDTTGTFQQVMTSTYDVATNSWSYTNAWLPAAAPAGVCVPVIVTPPVVTGNLPVVNAAKIPAAQIGYSGPRMGPAPGPFGQGDSQGPNPSDVGSFRLICHFSHMSNNDPLVFPGKKGASHLHTFVGNTGTDENSTVSTIANSGNSTCDGGTLNRSSYWFPSMIDTTDGTPQAPISMLVYYKTGYGGVKIADVKAVPTGLRMISGSAAGTPTSGTSASRYACLGGSDQDWHDYIPVCTAGATEMLMEVSFPQCWDGKNLSSPDNKSHMAETTGQGCPATHPVALPKIDYEIHYAVTKTMAKWRLSSDSYPTTSPGGYSGHGDYVMGWDVDTMAKIIKNCANPSIDCHTNLLGDGTWMY